VPNPQIVATEKKIQEDAAAPQSPLERRIAAVNAANRIFLMPYRDEIERLLTIVRSPANLPKS
jgi:hypothetical protein